MKIESVNIPKTMYTFNSENSTNTFIIMCSKHKGSDGLNDIQTNTNNIITKINIASGSYNSPIEFINQLNLDILHCVPLQLKDTSECMPPDQLSEEARESNEDFLNNSDECPSCSSCKGVSLLQVHLLNPLADKPKIVFINASEYAVKIIFYKIPGAEDIDLFGNGLSPDVHFDETLSVITKKKCSLLDPEINLCNNYPSYNHNIGYYMGYRIAKNINNIFYNTNSSQNELSIILLPTSNDKIKTKLQTIYNNIGFWDINYNSSLYAKDIYELIMIINPSNENIITSPDANACIKVANVPLRLNATRFLHICIDDYQKNRVPSNLVRTALQETRLDIPSYVNLENYSKSNNYNDQLDDLSAEVICDTNPNLSGKGNKLIVPNVSRKITQNQIYAANQILNGRRSIKKKDNTAILNVLATIPFNFNNEDITKVDLNFKPRVYFGPVSFDRLSVQLRDDRGYLVNLNGNDWSIILQIEQLYQY
jgi:hypothetical protein